MIRICYIKRELHWGEPGLLPKNDPGCSEWAIVSEEFDDDGAIVVLRQMQFFSDPEPE
jgi:hypothetical protein